MMTLDQPAIFSDFKVVPPNPVVLQPGFSRVCLKLSHPYHQPGFKTTLITQAKKMSFFLPPPRSFARVISENMNMLVGYGWVYYSMISHCMPRKTYIIEWVVCILPANLTVG